MYQSWEKIQRHKDEYRCMEHDKKNKTCRLNGQSTNCQGKLFNCSFFELRYSKGLMVLITHDKNIIEVEDAFYIDMCLQDDPEAHMRLAKIYEFKGHLEKAKGLYRYVMSLDPTNEEAQAAHSRLEMSLNKTSPKAD